MSRLLVSGGVVLAGLLAGAGCFVVCADCNCKNDGVSEVVGTVTTADRADLVGATVTVHPGSLSITYTRDDGSTWVAAYSL